MAGTTDFQHEWEEYLKQVESLSPIEQRIIAAVLGALVADAAGWYSVTFLPYSLFAYDCNVLITMY